MTEVRLKMIVEFHDNFAGKFELTKEVDPNTGEHKIKSVSRVTRPGQVNTFPIDEAKWLIGRLDARLLSDQEMALLRIEMTEAEKGLLEFQQEVCRRVQGTST